MSLEHRSSHNNTGIFIAIANKTLYGSQLHILFYAKKSLDIKIMFHEDILYHKYIMYILYIILT